MLIFADAAWRKLIEEGIFSPTYAMPAALFSLWLRNTGMRLLSLVLVLFAFLRACF